MAENVIQIKGIKKSFQVGEQSILILKGITFDIEEGEFLIIFGPSGCGKSTLLHTILGLEPPDEGSITFLGKDLYFPGSIEDDRSEFRKRHVGMVYQQPNWVKSLSVLGNVSFPLLLLGQDKTLAEEKANNWLDKLGMKDWSHHRPSDLSSGQQQRIALARAMVNDPPVVIADEPTGNLDFESGKALMQLLMDLNKTEKKTILMVTHDLEYMKYANTTVRMLDGSLVKIYKGTEKDKLMSELKGKRGSGMESK